MVENTNNPTKKKTTKKKTAKKKAPVRKKTVMRKKAPVRKTVAKEEQFDIQTSKDDAGFGDNKTTTINALDTADALDKLDKQNPEGYDEISIKKKSSGMLSKPTTAPVNSVSKTAVESLNKYGLPPHKNSTRLEDFGFSKKEAKYIEARSDTFKKDSKTSQKKTKRKTGVKVDVNTFELTEGFDSKDYKYPYSIVLPIGYEDFLSKAVGRSDEPIMIIESRGRLKTTLESEAAMDDFVKALVDMVVNENYADKAEMLIKGIVGSLRLRRR